FAGPDDPCAHDRVLALGIGRSLLNKALVGGAALTAVLVDERKRERQEPAGALLLPFLDELAVRRTGVLDADRDAGRLVRRLREDRRSIRANEAGADIGTLF